MGSLEHVYRHFLRFFIIASTFSLFISCSEPPQPPLRIASSPWPGYEPLHLARELGYLDEKKVSLFELPSSDITMASFRNHSTDLATLTLDETLELLHNGTKMKILLIMDISHGGDAVMAVPEIKTLQDLKGKRISIMNIPLGLYMLNRLLSKAGLERDEVEVFPMSETKQVQFYKEGKADAIITFDPIKTRLADEGLHVLFDSSDIPNEIFDILVVHDDVFNARRDDICEVVNQWYKTLEYMKSNKLNAAKTITRRLNLDVSEFDKMMSGIILPTREDNIKFLGGNTPALFKPIKLLSEIMVEGKQLSGPVDASAAIDSDFADCHKK